MFLILKKDMRILLRDCLGKNPNVSFNLTSINSVKACTGGCPAIAVGAGAGVAFKKGIEETTLKQFSLER